MAEQVRDRSLTESILSGLEKPGASARSMLFNLYSSEESAPAISDIMSGKATFSAREFINKIEDVTGMDLTAGGRDFDDQTKLDVGINIARDIAVDIFTSPESYIPFAAVAKKIGLTQKTIGNPSLRAMLKKAAKNTDKKLLRRTALSARQGLKSTKVQDRIITGASLGALTIDEKDNLLTAPLKIATGGTLGVAAPKILSTIGDVGQKYGGKAVDKLFDKMLPEVFESARTRRNITAFGDDITITNIAKVAKQSKNNVKELSLIHNAAHSKLEKTIADDFARAGLNPAQIEEKMNLLQRVRGSALSDTAKIRNNIEDFLKSKGISERESLKTATVMTNKLVGLKYLGRNLKGLLLKDMRKLDKFENVLSDGERSILREMKDPIINALLKADAKPIHQGFIDAMNEPIIASSVKKTVDVNRDMIKELNRRYLGTNRPELQFEGLDYHTIDLNSLDESLKESLAFGIKEGAYKRISPDVKVAGDKATRDFARDMGSLNFANLSLTKQELVARRTLINVFDKIEEATIKGAFNKAMNSDFSEVGRLAFKAHGQMMDAIKANHLVSSTNWVKNNYPENVLKAYIAAGSGNALEAALEIPVGMSKLAMKSMGMIDQLDNIKGYKNFSNGSAFADIYKAQDPRNLKKLIDYDDNMTKAASILNVVEHGKFVNLHKTALTDAKFTESIVDQASAFDKIGGENVTSVKASMTKAANHLERYSSFMWNGPLARIGTATEDSMRLVTWKNVMKSLEGKYPGFKTAMKETNGDMVEILRRTDSDSVNALKFSQVSPKEIEKEILNSQSSLVAAAGRDLSKEESKMITDFLRPKFDDINNRAFKNKRKQLEPFIQARKLMEEAAAITNNAFFDYADTTAFEQFIMKSIFPYWTYMSKSASYMADKMFDPEGLQRITKFSKIRANLGERPDHKERMGLQRFLLDKDALIGHSGKSTVNTPNLSFIDTLSLLDADEIVNRVSPLVKTPLSILTDRNFFTGKSLTPNENNPKVRIFEGKESLVGDPVLEAMGVFRNKSGDLYTNSPSATRLLELTKNLLPVPALDSFARIIRDIRFREDKSDEFIEKAQTAGKLLLKEFALPAQIRSLDRQKMRKSGKRRKTLLEKLDAGSKSGLFKSKRRRTRRRKIK